MECRIIDKNISRWINRFYGLTGQFKEGSWKEQSDYKFTPQNAQSVLRNLKRHGFIPPEDMPFVFYSPTASDTPTHELAMWQEDSIKRTASNLFIAGDLKKHSPEKGFSSLSHPDNSHHRFALLRNNALHPPLHPESVDVLWDRKGWLWHCASNPDWKAYIFDTLDAYQTILKVGGSLVVDAIPGFIQDRRKLIDLRGKKAQESFDYNRLPEYTPRDLFIGDVSQYEESTKEMLSRMLGIYHHIQKRFSMETIGEGVERVLVLTR